MKRRNIRDNENNRYTLHRLYGVDVLMTENRLDRRTIRNTDGLYLYEMSTSEMCRFEDNDDWDGECVYDKDEDEENYGCIVNEDGELEECMCISSYQIDHAIVCDFWMSILSKVPLEDVLPLGEDIDCDKWDYSTSPEKIKVEDYINDTYSFCFDDDDNDNDNEEFDAFMDFFPAVLLSIINDFYCREHAEKMMKMDIYDVAREIFHSIVSGDLPEIDMTRFAIVRFGIKYMNKGLEA